MIDARLIGGRGAAGVEWTTGEPWLRLTMAVEGRRRDGGLFDKPVYRQAHELLTGLLAEAGWGEPAELLAHALLGADPR